ncbi:ABC transporter permease [Streptomyces sp. NPDC006460]|uniref:ABC transporter permease n=1 Tax=Streptomyces sp. NPDC006460 TaxID=3154304 RepID=UPI0033A2004D
MNATLTRLTALGRAELTLLGRNRNNLFIALLMPLLMILVLRSSVTQTAEGVSGGVAGATLVGGTGMVLLLVVYMGLVSAYVARREELVLKRLRTGEASDLEILGGAALPSAAIALAQCVVLAVGGVLALDVHAPRRPDLLLLGLVAAVALFGGLAALTTVITRNVESAGLTTLPLFLVSSMGSGMFVPREALPDVLETVCALLPMSGVMEFVRAGWFGADDTGALVTAALTTLAWGGITVFAVRRWFRWEPRR